MWNLTEKENYWFRDLVRNNLSSDFKFCVCKFKLTNSVRIRRKWINLPENYMRIHLLYKCVPESGDLSPQEVLQFFISSGLSINESITDFMYKELLLQLQRHSLVLLFKKILFQRIPFNISRKLELCQKCSFVKENFLRLLDRLEHGIHKPYVQRYLKSTGWTLPAPKVPSEKPKEQQCLKRKKRPVISLWKGTKKKAEILDQSDITHSESNVLQPESSQTTCHVPMEYIQEEVIQDTTIYSDVYNSETESFAANKNNFLQIDKIFSLLEENISSNINCIPQNTTLFSINSGNDINQQLQSGNENNALHIDEIISVPPNNIVSNLSIISQDVCSVNNKTENCVEYTKELVSRSDKNNFGKTVRENKRIVLEKCHLDSISVTFGKFVGKEISVIEDEVLFVKTKHRIQKILMDAQVKQMKINKLMMVS